MSGARRVASAAVSGGGGVGAAGLLAAVLLLGQARLARRTIPLAEAPPPRCDGRYGTEYPGEPIRLAMLGDSSAAGLGVDLPRETPGAVLASGLAERMRRPILLRSFAVVGATSSGLVPQWELALEWPPAGGGVLCRGHDDAPPRPR